MAKAILPFFPGGRGFLKVYRAPPNLGFGKQKWLPGPPQLWGPPTFLGFFLLPEVTRALGKTPTRPNFSPKTALCFGRGKRGVWVETWFGGPPNLGLGVFYVMGGAICQLVGGIGQGFFLNPSYFASFKGPTYLSSQKIRNLGWDFKNFLIILGFQIRYPPKKQNFGFFFLEIVFSIFGKGDLLFFFKFNPQFFFFHAGMLISVFFGVNFLVNYFFTPP